MVSASPIEAIIFTSIRLPGFTARTIRSPSHGVAASRSGRGIRPPGSAGTEPSITRPADPLRVGQGVPGGPDAAARCADENSRLEVQGVEHVADEVHGVLAEVSRLEGVRLAEAAAGAVDEVGAKAGRPAREHQVGERRGVGAVQVHHRWAVAGRHDMDAGAPTGAGRDVPARRQSSTILRNTSSIATVCRGRRPGVAGRCSCAHDPSGRRGST